MSQNILLLVALVLPVVLFAVLRTNAAMIFLSLCLGAILVQYVASQANDLLQLISPRLGSASASTVQISFLLVPAVITTIVTIFSVQGRTKWLINLLPAITASMLAVLLVVPLLPAHISDGLKSQQVWNYLSHSEALVVSTGALVSLMFLWTQRQSSPRRKRHH
ncbi:MAG TPA: hypothetical protein VMR45_05610 [Patescibacteria group bacterium]|nr:hypothetical protein [Patescibacteria group bacterium]